MQQERDVLSSRLLKCQLPKMPIIRVVGQCSRLGHTFIYIYVFAGRLSLSRHVCPAQKAVQQFGSNPTALFDHHHTPVPRERGRRRKTKQLCGRASKPSRDRGQGEYVLVPCSRHGEWRTGKEQQGGKFSGVWPVMVDGTELHKKSSLKDEPLASGHDEV
jgi:hypothetical protein